MIDSHRQFTQAERDQYSVYRCPLCRGIYVRKDKRAWIKSYCGEFNKYTRLVKIKEELE